MYRHASTGRGRETNKNILTTKILTHNHEAKRRQYELRYLYCKGPRLPTQHQYDTYICIIRCVPDLIIVQIFRTVSKIENGISSIQSVEKAAIKWMNAKLKDVRFVDDAVLMIAISGQSESLPGPVQFNGRC